MGARTFPWSSVEAGRRYVAAYLDFIQYLERLEEALVIPDEDSSLAPDHSTPD
jgi:hypothetical protein